ncbi:hypothetical protein ACFXTI_007478 [Malus domestica]
MLKVKILVNLCYFRVSLMYLGERKQDLTHACVFICRKSSKLVDLSRWTLRTRIVSKIRNQLVSAIEMTHSAAPINPQRYTSSLNYRIVVISMSPITPPCKCISYVSRLCAKVLELDAGQQQGHGNRDDIANLRHAEVKILVSTNDDPQIDTPVSTGTHTLDCSVAGKILHIG